jgi:acyl-CoA reductase-like NAD-dependent aldehyde dehydrogenase
MSVATTDLSQDATTNAAAGIPQHKEEESAFPGTPQGEIDSCLTALAEKKGDWARLPVADRRAILCELMKDFLPVAARWAEAVCVAEGIPKDTPTAGEEWLAGPYMVLRNLRLLEVALGDMEITGKPRIPGPVRTRPDGQVTAQVFPQSAYDRVLYTGISAEVWMESGVTVESLPVTQATAYSGESSKGAVCLVLGAGNVSSIGAMDLLYKLFVENQVVILKMHPLNAYLGPLIAEGFQALLDWGVLRIVYGGPEIGDVLCRHSKVDEIHITGSDKTVETIVFGPGEGGHKRKTERRPLNGRPISSELGNVSPVIVVPGPWSAADLAYHGENLATMLTNNAGFNCNATRVIVQHEAWSKRQDLTNAVRHHLGTARLRKAYYPGAADRHATFLAAHPEAERFGTPAEGELPWTLIADLDAESEQEICFNTEAFCGVFSETALAADSVAEYLERAVDFVNERLWGTLNCSLLIHPASLRDPTVAAAFDHALANLRYGAVCVNSWAAICYGLVITPWGAYPGHDIYDIQSGTGLVHNTLMFSRVQKTVVHTPFRMQPKPVWFQSHRTVHRLAEKLTHFEADPSPFKLPGIFWEALRG